MTPRYDSLRNKHIDRDAAIREYARQHPDYAHWEIAEHFASQYGLCRSRITQILGKGKKEALK
jgi:hypothetical protein